MDHVQSIETTQMLIENEVFFYGGAFSDDERHFISQIIYHLSVMANNGGDASHNINGFILMHEQTELAIKQLQANKNRR